jgi:DNA-binding transcriptional MerR regulator
MSMAVRSHMSIGEVLNLLKDEFPDVTISKIRFLESQGLLEPERTPSGYRKFFDEDVERLRFILREQRERFLPLKVIKRKLAAWDTGNHPLSPASGASVVGPEPDPVSDEDELIDPPTSIALTLEELAHAVGLDRELIAEMRNFRLIRPHVNGSSQMYDADALLVAKLAKGFFKYGVEPRHLRMYRTTADRESSFFEQVVTPLVRQRNPEARRMATEALVELSSLARQFKAALLRANLRAYLHD